MRYLGLLFFFLTTLPSWAQQSSSVHGSWTNLLQKHVDANGWVSYKDFLEDSLKLNDYLNLLSANPPSDKWTREEKLAYWINAYNAFTVKLITKHHPVSSIKDIKKGIPLINSVWDIKFFEIGGAKMNLNEIEHSILRKEFDEPRIHFSIVCASASCPKLRNEAFTAEKLEQQLESQAIDFINDRTKNEIEMEEIRISSIFKWFNGDFTKNGTIQEFIRPFSEQDFISSAKVKYLQYNWNLNGE